VAQFVFHIIAQCSKRLLKSRGHKQRVVTKTFLPVWGEPDVALTDAFE
jgi:hypothetical protein